MKNKKGDNHFLSSEILGIVLAIFGIVILILLATKFYGLFDSKTEIEQARESLANIQSTIENVEKESGSDEYLLLTPRNWAIIKWPPYVPHSETVVDKPTYKLLNALPDQCVSKNWQECICLCKDPFTLDCGTGVSGKCTVNVDVNQCNKLGFCYSGNLDMEFRKNKDIAEDKQDSFEKISNLNDSLKFKLENGRLLIYAK